MVFVTVTNKELIKDLWETDIEAFNFQNKVRVTLTIPNTHKANVYLIAFNEICKKATAKRLSCSAIYSSPCF